MLTRILISFVVIWILLYLFAFFVIMTPDDVKEIPKIELPVIKIETPSDSSLSKIPIEIVNTRINSNTNLNSNTVRNPFLSDQCKSRIELLESATVINEHSVAIIMTVRNEKPEKVVQSIKSIFLNSNNLIGQMIIVDDLSNDQVNEWPQWSTIGDEYFKKMHFLRPGHRLGVSGSKHYGSDFAKRSNTLEYYVFVDAHIVVSESWLLPLIDTLVKHPKAIVYPTIDVLTDEGLIQSDNMIGGFNWELKFVWESWDSKRMPLLPEYSSSDDIAVSTPAAPGILAIASKFYEEVGGFETALSLWGVESVELSIRSWMCGGLVIKQPCSRVAHYYSHLFQDSIVGNGVTQGVVDHEVLAIAERYMSKNYKETVFQARFTGRVPYSVELDQGERFSPTLHGNKMLVTDSCQDFDWYLNEVYLGLLQDAQRVEENYRNHLSSGYLVTAQHDLLEQYNKKTSENIVLDDLEIKRLQKFAETADEKSIQQRHDSFIPKKVPYIHPQDSLLEFAKVAMEKKREELLKKLGSYNLMSITFFIISVV